MKILLAEDDPMIGENIQIALEREGVDVRWVSDGMEAETALETENFDAMLLDLGLPSKDGLDILQGLRTRGSNIPVLIITARDSVAQRVLGLRSGADDYLVKPFDFEELEARLHALIRRARGGGELIFRSGNVVINAITREVLVDGAQVILSGREWTLLDALIARPGAVLSRQQIEEKLYGWSGEVESNAVEVYVHGLRKKLGQQFVVTVRGVGYKVEKP
jgi:two-component system, OmpR family, response regulator QseB